MKVLLLNVLLIRLENCGVVFLLFLLYMFFIEFVILKLFNVNGCVVLILMVEFILLDCIVVVDVLCILRLFINLEVIVLKLNVCELFLDVIWWLFINMVLNCGLKLCMVISWFLLFEWLIDMLVICCSDLVKLVLGKLLMFFVLMVLIMLVELCLIFIDFVIDEWILFILIIFMFLLGCVFWVNVLFVEIVDVKIVVIEYVSLVFLYMMVCVLIVNFNVFYGVYFIWFFFIVFCC